MHCILEYARAELFVGSEQAKTLQMQVVALQERVRELELAAKTGQESSGLYVPPRKSI